VRPPPSYRWIDYSPVDRNDPNRRPNRMFKLRKTSDSGSKRNVSGTRRRTS
jgi:hypothetical protein